MLIVENTAALVVFALWVVGFALGYLLRNWVDGARADWHTYTYREKGAHDGRN